ncbi:MAG: hypothetical protein ACE5FK_01340 [Candidatus Methylomirabilia bacterium]
MPYNDPDPADPTVLVGVVLPAEAAAFQEMAYVFAEEFARTGFDEARLMRLFRNPFYAGAHQVYRKLGEPAVREIVEECVRVWGRGRLVAEGTTPEGVER